MDGALRLFKAVPISKKGQKKPSKELLKETIKLGFIFAPEVAYNYSDKQLLKMAEYISKEVGLSADKMNASFHKSWKKIKDADIEQLVLEQILHYITTYGFEAMGAYRTDTIYIPCEDLKIPKIKLDKISLIVIKGYTKDELKEKLIALLGTGIALKEDTKKDVIDIATFVEISEAEIFNIKNKEVRVALYDLLDVCPEDPTEFLRYMIYKSTNRTLLIKDKLTITEIKAKDNLCALGLLTKHQKKYGLERLAEIFYRFKPLFLAFRTNSKLKTTINKIRKLAVKYHKPMKFDFLNSVTAMVNRGDSLHEHELSKALMNVNIFRKIRLAYALKYRTDGNVDSIMYRIRNGKSYSTDFKSHNPEGAQNVLNVVIGSIVEDIKKNVDGKKIYIPKNLHYALPTTEKQFTGDLPSGTYVSVPKDIVVGVHWFDVNGERVDLDLSMIKCDGGKIGWDGYYRHGDGDILFSGDMTAAPKPNGASELFYIKKQTTTSFILMLNYFNHGGRYGDDCESKFDVPFKILVASEQVKDFKGSYMVNPNNVICVAKSTIGEKQKTLGLLVTTPTEGRFYFCETYMGNTITSYGGKDYIQHARKYMFDFYTNTIDLKGILVDAGAEIVKDTKDCDVDLSYEKIERDSLIKLLTKK